VPLGFGKISDAAYRLAGLSSEYALIHGPLPGVYLVIFSLISIHLAVILILANILELLMAFMF